MPKVLITGRCRLYLFCLENLVNKNISWNQSSEVSIDYFSFSSLRGLNYQRGRWVQTQEICKECFVTDVDKEYSKGAKRGALIDFLKEDLGEIVRRKNANWSACLEGGTSLRKAV